MSIVPAVQVIVIPSNGELGLEEVKVRALLLLIDIGEDWIPLNAMPPKTSQEEESWGWILNKLAPLEESTKNVPLVSDVVKNFIIIFSFLATLNLLP